MRNKLDIMLYRDSGSKQGSVKSVLLFSDSLDVFDPVLLLLVRQADDIGGRGSGGSVIHSLDTRRFLQTKPANTGERFVPFKEAVNHQTNSFGDLQW